ncbi:MAG: YqgE/AlgH family protein [Flavobacteriales bacterium]|nr:YqgE/AlgH family protein [Flavobacteriales bacterium]MBP7154957.1 YqgE/AlgH family protein [Flavobacteriales bacterium]
MARDHLDLDPENRIKPARGRLLVSEPFLPDPYFRRTVVLLCEHNEEGSFGFVLNRHMDMAVSDLMENLPPVASQVSIGGPVKSSNLYYLHTLGKRISGSEEVVDGVFMGGDYEQLSGVLSADERLSKHVRFFVGYSGWGKDQLDKELEEKAWLVSNGEKARIMDVRTSDLWAQTLRAMGKPFAPLANFPDDPSLN